MIKYEIDENGFLTGNWAKCGGFERYIELENELSEIDKNMKCENGVLNKSINPKEEEKILKVEMNSLKEWFNKFYDYKEQKYRRLINLNILDDDNQDPQSKIGILYHEAEVKRKRIQEIEALLNK